MPHDGYLRKCRKITGEVYPGFPEVGVSVPTQHAWTKILLVRLLVLLNYAGMILR
jgi:hypothetical protein